MRQRRKTMRSYKFDALTLRQIAELSEWWEASATRVIEASVAKAHAQEVERRKQDEQTE